MALFVSLSILILGNINGLLRLLYGIRAPISLLILFLSLVSVGILLTKTKNKYHIVFSLFTVFLLSYLFIGTIGLGLFYEDHHPNIDHVNLYRKYIPTILVVYVFYKMTVYLHRNEFPAWFYYSIFSILTFVACITAFGYELNITSAFEFANSNITAVDARRMGFFENPNEAGFQACFTLVFALFMYTHPRFRFKIIYLIVVAISLYAVYKSFSRAAFAGSFLILITFLYINIRHFGSIKGQTKWMFLIFLGGLIFSINFGVNNYDAVLKNFTRTQQKRVNSSLLLFAGKTGHKSSAQDRLKVLRLGWEQVKQRPLTGNGIGAFNRLKNHGVGVHNTYLLVLGDSGIIPFSLLLIFFIYFFIQSIRIKNVSYKFLLLAIYVTLAITIFMTSHNGLEYRVGNVMFGLSFGFLDVLQKQKLSLL